MFLIELMRIRSNLHLFATLTQSETIAHLGSLARASKSVATLVRLLVSPVRELCDDVLQRFVTSRSGFRSNDPFVEHGDERIFANRIQARFTVPFAFYNHLGARIFEYTDARYNRRLWIYVHPRYMELQVWTSADHPWNLIAMAELITLTPRFDAKGQEVIAFRGDRNFCFRGIRSFQALLTLARLGEFAKPPRYVPGASGVLPNDYGIFPMVLRS